MSIVLKTATVLLLPLLEQLFVFLPATLLFLLLLNYYQPKQTHLLLAFLAGVVIDLLQVQPLGKTSIALVVILFVSYLYADKMRRKTHLFLGITIFIALFLYAVFTLFI